MNYAKLNILVVNINLNNAHAVSAAHNPREVGKKKNNLQNIIKKNVIHMFMQCAANKKNKNKKHDDVYVRD